MTEPVRPVRQCVFVGGCPRSGTTLLGSILGTAHGAVATPESQFKSEVGQAVGRGEVPATAEAILRAMGAHWRFALWNTPLPSAVEVEGDDPADAILAVVHRYAESIGRPGRWCWVDHTPDNVRHAPWLLESFPEARMIHLVRDGRGVAASLMRMDTGPVSPMAAAKLWVQDVGVGLAMEDAFPERVMRVRYERLVRDPETTVREVCAFSGVDYAPAMLEGSGFEVPTYTRDQHELVGRRPDPSAADRWREALSPREIELVEFVAGPMLEALGYELVHGGHPRPPSFGERLAGLGRDLVWSRVRSTLLRWRRRRRAGV